RIGEHETEIGTHKADNPNLLIPLITMLALNVSGAQREEHFKIACGLPISEFSQDRERFKKMLQGKYEVRFLSKRLNDRVVRIYIDDVVIIPEGVAVVMNQMLNENGTGFRRPELRHGQLGVIDVGAFTTDIPVIVN